MSALGTFVSDELEAHYRAGERAHDVRVARAVAVLAVVINIPLGIVDYVFQHESALLYLLMAARIVNASLALLVFARISSLTSARARDRVFLLWAGVIAVASVALVLSRPPGFGGPLAMGMVVIAAFALVLPASFRYQVAAVSVLVVAFVSARVAQGSSGTAALISTSSVLTIGVVLSLFASLLNHRTRRALFLAQHEQRTLRGALELALAEIRTLRGVVPICAFCHKIRDESGAWHRVEAYVSERTHAEFSHGFCPTCEETHYPENA
jgi:hypothetical protein